MYGLNPQQTDALTTVQGAVMVLAGAGSGKTRVITQKMTHLIQAYGYRGRDILALTFTNKAAREMQSRVQQLLQDTPHCKSQAKGLTVCTFHRLGLQFVRQEAGHLGYKPNVSILDTSDQATILREWVSINHLAQVQSQISAWKNALIAPDHIEKNTPFLYPDSTDNPWFVEIYEKYQRQIRAYNAVDFDDLLYLPVALCQKDAEISQKWANQFAYILVDEYQDTNTAQYLLLQKLVAQHQNFTVVGDDDQSIYAWRGASSTNLTQLSQDFDLKIIKLEQNYRSVGRILRCANAVIANNPRPYPKQLWSTLGEGERIRVIPCADPDVEIERIVHDLLSHKLRFGRSFSEYAILYRSNHVARGFEKGLRERNIQYRISGGQSFFDKTEIKDIMAYLRLMANPEDDMAFLRIINVPRRDIGAATLEKLGEYAKQRECSLFDAACEMKFTGLVQGAADRELIYFCQWMENLMRSIAHYPPLALAQKVLADIHYEEWLLNQATDKKQAERRWQNLQEFLAWFGRMAGDETTAHQRNLAQTIQHLTLIDMLDRQDNDNNPECVSLMTIHAAKGLEFPFVYVVSAEEGILPHQNSLDEGTLEEERRLMYVAITRAQQGLTVSYAQKRRRSGEWQESEASRFLQELPVAELDWELPPDQQPNAERKARGRAHLAALKVLLSEV